MARMTISNAGCASNSTLHALNSARQNRRNAACEFVLQQLKKDGTPSKMYHATTYCRTEAEALAYVARIRELNPGKVFRWTLNGTEV